jgi:hypothetical protein
VSRWSVALREELSRLALAYGDSLGALSYRSNGNPGVTLFPVAADGSGHGNFLPSSSPQSEPKTQCRLSTARCQTDR